MQFRGGVRRHILMLRVEIRLAEDQMISQRDVDFQALSRGLVDQPGERKLRQTAFAFRIAAADVGVHAGEPDLLDVLRDLRRMGIKRIGDEVLRLSPAIEPEQTAALVDRHGMAKDFNAGIPGGVRQCLQRRKGVEAIPPRHDQGSDRIPNADEFDRDPSCAGNAAEIPGEMKIVLFARLLVRGQRVIRDIRLIGIQQPDHMDEGGKRANRIGAAAEAEQEDGVAVLILLREESVGAENFIVQAVTRGQFKNRFRILFQPRPCIVGADRSDARLVADALR